MSGGTGSIEQRFSVKELLIPGYSTIKAMQCTYYTSDEVRRDAVLSACLEDVVKFVVWGSIGALVYKIAENVL